MHSKDRYNSSRRCLWTRVHYNPHNHNLIHKPMSTGHSRCKPYISYLPKHHHKVLVWVIGPLIAPHSESVGSNRSFFFGLSDNCPKSYRVFVLFFVVNSCVVPREEQHNVQDVPWTNWLRSTRVGNVLRTSNVSIPHKPVRFVNGTQNKSVGGTGGTEIECGQQTHPEEMQWILRCKFGNLFSQIIHRLVGPHNYRRTSSVSSCKGSWCFPLTDILFIHSTFVVQNIIEC